MDEKRASFRLSAPAASGSTSALRLPGRDAFPGVDDHLVEPEVTRDEIINGRRVVAMPALPPHADKQVDLDYLLRAHAAPGYRVAADLLTRHAVDSDFASDACLYKEGVDPATGARHLEEFAFEVVSEQNEKVVREKAAAMHRRGVRRIFAIFVKGRQRVCEWSPESHGWTPLAADSRIEDRCLAVPLSVAALLDAASADNAVAEALIAKGNPAILKREDAAEARGKAIGLAQGKVLGILEARGIAVSLAQRQEILRCQDLDRLDRWLRRAALTSSADEVLAEP
jgi:hypothetical protein